MRETPRRLLWFVGLGAASLLAWGAATGLAIASSLLHLFSSPRRRGGGERQEKKR